MTGAANLIILEEILSMPVALLLESPCKRWQTLLTVTGWNAANSDWEFLTYVSKLEFEESILLTRSGPIIEKYSLKPSAISSGLVKFCSPTFS
jgi:hypothetical protein